MTAVDGTKSITLPDDRFVERGLEVEKIAGEYGNACNTDIPIRGRRACVCKDESNQIKPGMIGSKGGERRH